MIFMKIWEWFSLNIVSPINWSSLKALFNKGVYWELTELEHNKLRTLLAKDHYIILIRRKTHLTTYLISLGNYIRTGKLGYWSHALVNLEDSVQTDFDYQLLESIGVGTKFSSFMQVFDCDSVCLLKPYCLNETEWTHAVDQLRLQEGKPYDTVFKLVDETKLSCCELVYEALKNDIWKMPTFNRMIKEHHNQVTPDMFYNCKGDFEVVFEVRH